MKSFDVVYDVFYNPTFKQKVKVDKIMNAFYDNGFIKISMNPKNPQNKNEKPHKINF